MEIFIRGLVALGIALAVAAYGFSQSPQGMPAQNGAVVQNGAAADADTGSGWAPWIKNRFSGGGVSIGHGGLCFGKHHSASAPAPESHKGHAPRTQPGTVVFPQHPFARSPRDFFMVD